MAQPGDIIYREIGGVNVPFIKQPDGRYVRAEGYEGQGFDNTSSGFEGFQGPGFYAGGQAGAIGGVLGATGPTTSPAGKAAIDRLQNQKDREACNASGGFYTLG